MKLSQIQSGPDNSKVGDRYNEDDPAQAPYFPPCSLVLDILGISIDDLESDRVSVPGKSLRALISELAKSALFDREWYARTNPDVEGARLAGDIRSLRRHFIMAGYFEGRLPHDPHLDVKWYREHYKDIAKTFSPGDIGGIRDHFRSKGYFEGRAGTAETLAAAEYWHRLAGR